VNQKLRFGVITLQEAPWPEMVRRWQEIEALNFDSVWLADHFVNYAQPQQPWFEAWTALAALAAATSRIRIGTLVTTTAWRNPAWLARQALTVDHISDGRLELGLGAGVGGTADCSHAMTGIQDLPPPQRVARFREGVEIIDGLLRHQSLSFQGRYYQIENAAMQPPPVQRPRPPITIGALGPVMLRITAQYGDCWNSFGGRERGLTSEKMLAATKARSARLDDYCLEIGRDPGTLRRSLLIYGPEARRAAASADGFADVVGRYREIGITEFILYYPMQDAGYALFERIASEAIPGIRAGILTTN
jgi:alkanesulfonate monooxygenase SsuD/methylene tetrahydromethanopterin reductase-like flavin-dependent oxidoreductase (luciferase family)